MSQNRKDLIMNQSGLYLRRCHVCGATIECGSNNFVACNNCGKKIAPFFYFDERQIIGFGDVIGEQMRKGDSQPAYVPLIGIGLYWDADLELLLQKR